jgi:hypothetical protein
MYVVNPINVGVDSHRVEPATVLDPAIGGPDPMRVWSNLSGVPRSVVAPGTYFAIRPNDYRADGLFDSRGGQDVSWWTDADEAAACVVQGERDSQIEAAQRETDYRHGKADRIRQIVRCADQSREMQRTDGFYCHRHSDLMDFADALAFEIGCDRESLNVFNVEKVIDAEIDRLTPDVLPDWDVDQLVIVSQEPRTTHISGVPRQIESACRVIGYPPTARRAIDAHYSDREDYVDPVTGLVVIGLVMPRTQEAEVSHAA